MEMANIRAKLTIQKMVGNGCKPRSLAAVMEECGYSKSYAHNPQKIKRTRFWQDYLKEFISDEQIVSAHKNLLEAQRISSMEFPASLADKEIKEILSSSGRKVLTTCRGTKKVTVTFTEPDCSIQATAIDLAYKIKGLYNNQLSNSFTKK
jgi:hypothetical protein